MNPRLKFMFFDMSGHDLGDVDDYSAPPIGVGSRVRKDWRKLRVEFPENERASIPPEGKLLLRKEGVVVGLSPTKAWIRWDGSTTVDEHNRHLVEMMRHL